MKKIVLFFIASFAVLQVQAQNINPETDYVPGKAPKEKFADSLFTGWCIDLNATGGFLMQNITSGNQAANYTNALNANISTPKFENGVSRGLDVQAGYFFGCKRHFGIGTGLMYMYQQGDLVMDNFHVEYKSADYYNNTFRQVLTSNGQIKESLGISNLSIPLVFKYRTWFSKKVGFTADAGILISLQEKNNYSTHASFDYEAIYQYSGVQGEIVPVYDNSPKPAPQDLLLTRNAPTSQTNGDVQAYFNTLRNQGYNVGLGVRPNNNKGSVTYNGSVGLLLRPAVSFALCDHFSLNLGLYYVYQDFTNSASAGYRITDKVGGYNTMLNNISNASNNSIGISIGGRYSFCRHRPEPLPEEAPAPEVEETPQPPTASAVNEEEAAEPEPADMSTPILFDVDKTEIKPEAYPVLEDAVKQLGDNKSSSLIINGYTDNTGRAKYNAVLSKRRANAVRNYLKEKGVKPRVMKTVGHGQKHPAASNSTEEGRAKNRRVMLKLKTGRSSIHI